jgi:hypothetical protein
MASQNEPPTAGPQPPAVPSGWKAQYSDQHQAWFVLLLSLISHSKKQPTDRVHPGST